METPVIDILDRYFTAFIGLDNQRDFFVGFADYLDFTNSIASFGEIAVSIRAPKKKLENKLEKLNKAALKKLAIVRAELQNYVTEQNIKNSWIDEAFNNYDGWLTKKIVGSSAIPDALHDELRDVVEMLYHMPEQKPGQEAPLPEAAKHRAFAERYIQFNKSKTLVEHYLPVKEVFDFLEVENDYKSQRNTALWGQLDQISTFYNAIKTGKELHKKLVAEHQKTHSTQAAWNIMNHNVVVSEWLNIEEHGSHEPAYFFKINKVRPWMTRLHNYIIAHYVAIQAVKELSEPSNAATSAVVDKKEPLLTTSSKARLIVEKNKKGTSIGYLQLAKHARKLKIGEASSRKFKLMMRLFNAEGSADGPYYPIAQSSERVFEGIQLPSDKSNGKLANFSTKQNEMLSIVKGTIKEIRRDASLRRHVDFKWNNDVVRMEIKP